jgi:hypothetical protein
MTQTLEERIAEFKQIYTGLPKAKDALEIIIELQAENQALLAKNIEDAKEHHQDFKAVAEKNEALEARVKELEGKVEIAKDALALLDDECLGKRVDDIVLNAIRELNKQGEAHDE